MALWHEPLQLQGKPLKSAVTNRAVRVTAMWIVTTLWVVVGASVPKISHNLALMIGVTLLLIGPTCCAQIGWLFGSQIARVRIQNDQYIKEVIAPEVYFSAGRLYERQNVETRGRRGNVIPMNSSHRPFKPCPPDDWASPVDDANGIRPN